MTTREFYTAIASAQNLDVELTEKAAELIAALDHKNELRKSKPSKDSLESAARRQAVREFFEAAGNGQLFDRDAVAEALGITPGQATAAMTALVKAEVLTKIEGKGKTKTVYQLA